VTHPVERCTVAHAAAIAQIEAAAASTRWSRQSVTETLCHAATLGWIVRRDGEIVGHLLTRIAGDAAEVLTLTVIPESRRQGRANALLAHAEEAWRKSGVEEGFLEVRTSNTAARALYRHRGWEEVGARAGYYSDGEDAVLMRWESRCGG